MKNIIEMEDDYVVVQPGLVKGILDRELKMRKKFFPPDPASSNFCTMGGMITNNSSGAHCLVYGNTIDFVEDVNVVYSDGKKGFAGQDRYDTKIDQVRKLILPFTDFI